VLDGCGSESFYTKWGRMEEQSSAMLHQCGRRALALYFKSLSGIEHLLLADSTLALHHRFAADISPDWRELLVSTTAQLVTNAQESEAASQRHVDKTNYGDGDQSIRPN
jgi:hypothetical protein